MRMEGVAMSLSSRCFLNPPPPTSQAKPEDDSENPASPLKPGQPGFRWHAAIPQAASLDYVKKPESRVVMAAKSGAAKGSSKVHVRAGRHVCAWGGGARQYQLMKGAHPGHNDCTLPHIVPFLSVPTCAEYCTRAYINGRAITTPHPRTHMHKHKHAH